MPPPAASRLAPPTQPPDPQTAARLEWLAAGMRVHGLSTFSVASLQPSWLPGRWWRAAARWAPVALCAVGCGVWAVVVLIGYTQWIERVGQPLLRARLSFDVPLDLLASIGRAWALATAVDLGTRVLRRTDTPIRLIPLRSSRDAAASTAPDTWVLAALIVIVSTLLLSLAIVGAAGRFDLRLFAPAFSLTLWAAAVAAIVVPTIERWIERARRRDRRVDHRAALRTALSRGAVVGGGVAAVALVLPLGFVPALAMEIDDAFIVLLVPIGLLLFGILLAALAFPVAAMAYGWFDVVAHLVLRAALALRGPMPLRLGRFLEDAVERGHLVRVDGGYELTQ